jgi:hypothetical protein
MPRLGSSADAAAPGLVARARTAACARRASAARPSRVTRRLARAIVLGALAAGCGVGTRAPVLRGLVLAPDRPLRPGDTLGAQARYTDEDGDLGGGRAEVTLVRIGESSGVVLELPLASGESLFEGTISVQVRLPEGLVAGRFDLGLVAIDGAGRRSAPVVAGFDVTADP